MAISLGRHDGVEESNRKVDLANCCERERYDGIIIVDKKAFVIQLGNLYALRKRERTFVAFGFVMHSLNFVRKVPEFDFGRRGLLGDIWE